MKTSHFAKFNTPSVAARYVANSPRALVVMHGDDGLLWCVPGRYVKQLEEAGYERA